MSIKLMSQVWEAKLSFTDKFVLLALADNANDEGACWPSIETLCKKTCLSERTVHYAIKRLETGGYLSTRKRFGSSNVYCVTPTRGAPDAPVHQMHPAPDAPRGARHAPEGAPDAPLGVHHMHLGGATRAPITIMESSVEPSREPSREPSGNPLSRAKPPDDVLRIFDHWRSTWNHPSSALDPKRTATIKRALKGYSVDVLCESISGYLASPHHIGQNDRNTVYDDLGLFLRDSAHIDAGLRFARAAPVLSSKVDQHNIAVLSAWRPPEMRDAAAGLSEISGNHGDLGNHVRKRALPAAN